MNDENKRTTLYEQNASNDITFSLTSKTINTFNCIHSMHSAGALATKRKTIHCEIRSLSIDISDIGFKRELSNC